MTLSRKGGAFDCRGILLDCEGGQMTGGISQGAVWLGGIWAEFRFGQRASDILIYCHNIQ